MSECLNFRLFMLSLWYWSLSGFSCCSIVKLNNCGIKFMPFNDILVHFNFNFHDIICYQIVKKIWCKFVIFFSPNFLLNYTLCHLSAWSHRGDSNEMLLCIISWNGMKTMSSLIMFFFYINLCCSFYVHSKHLRSCRDSQLT